jgi:Dyp-type peroxidase family
LAPSKTCWTPQTANSEPRLELEDIQSPILRRRPAPYVGSFILLRIVDRQQGREFVRRLAPHVVSAAAYDASESWLSVAFTYAGLAALGVPEASLASFPHEFREGMAARADRLGDTGESAPERWDAPFGTGELHAAIALLAVSEAKWSEQVEIARREAASLTGITVLHSDRFFQVRGGRTHLGFKDGVSFPTIAGNGHNPIPDAGPPIAAGEFVLGYPSETGVPLAMPQPDVLGRNGTFAGLRKVHVRVAAFRRFLRENASEKLSQELLAAKMIGRWRSGAPLELSPESDDAKLAEDPLRMNDFGYADDPAGLRCPLGAHVRRMNPRDSAMAVMSHVDLHRIIRHGAIYGTPLADGVLDDDGVDRGIFFIFLSARAPETFEFLKSEWTNSGNFIGLGDEKDPVCGANDGSGTFTIPMRPIRRRIHGIERFAITRGGEYAFMPSLSALRWLGELDS